MSLAEHSKVYQRDVYKFAGELAQKHNLNSYLDVGCGYPSKIKEFIHPHIKDITGLDLAEVVDQAKDIGFGTWKATDLEKNFNLERKFDLIVSADVIEHLQNPIKLLDSIRKHCTDDTYVIISTPDGDTTRKIHGRPSNSLHVQEWNTEEFVALLKAYDFEVLEKKTAIEHYNLKETYIGNYFLCKKSKRIKVLISVPNLHWIHQHVTHKLLVLQKDNRYRTTMIFPVNKPYENNLHHIIKDFLEGDYDFWLNIDADNPPRKNPLDLIELDKDVIGLPTPIWHYDPDKDKGQRPIYWNAYDFVSDEDGYKEHQNRDGLQRVDAVGTGCVLYARRVFENKELQKGAFTRKLDAQGCVIRGNDLAFCERAKEQGFEIYCHFDYPCNHFSEVELNEVVDGFRNLYETDTHSRATKNSK